jgi:hypothetical protein
MNIRQIVFAAILLGTLIRFGPAMAEDGFPATDWERVNPAELGWSDAGLEQAQFFSDQIRSSAVVIVQHGKVVAEWGNTTKPMQLASIRKSLLGALIGIAVSDHLIKLDSTLGELGIDDNPPGLTEIAQQGPVHPSRMGSRYLGESCRHQPARDLRCESFTTGSSRQQVRPDRLSTGRDRICVAVKCRDEPRSDIAGLTRYERSRQPR